MPVDAELRLLNIDIPAQPDVLVRLSLLLAEEDVDLKAVSAMIDRSHSVAKTLPPPIAAPLIRAITGLGMSRMIDCSSAMRRPTMPRPSYCPSCADWSCSQTRAAATEPGPQPSPGHHGCSGRTRPRRRSAPACCAR